MHFELTRPQLLLLLKAVDEVLVEDRFLLLFVEAYEFQCLKSGSLELIELESLLEDLEDDQIAVAELLRLLYPLEYHFLVCDLLNLQPLMRFELLLGRQIEDDQSEAEDVRFKGIGARYFIILRLY